MSLVPVTKLMDELINVSFEDYALFHLDSDLLSRKIPKDIRLDLVKNAIESGFHEADIILNEYKSFDSYFDSLDLNITLKDQITDGAKRIVFGYFRPKNNIYINLEPLRNSRLTVKSLNEELKNNLCFENLKNLIIAHELFHLVEDKKRKTIYSKTCKIVLWKLFGFKYKSTIPTISEISAMAFAKRLTNFKYCPFILDPLLQYAFLPKMSSLHLEALTQFLKEKES